MKIKSNFQVLLSAVLVLSIGFTCSSVTFALSKPTAASRRLSDWLSKKKNLPVVACPAFMSSTRSGLASSLASPSTVCLKSGSLSKAFKGVRIKPPKASRFILSGSYEAGSPFSPVVGQQGDVQTDLFVVRNAPALISYRVTDGTFNTMLRIMLFDAETGQQRQELYRVRGKGDGSFAWNYPGSYFLKMQALPDAEAEVQPTFDISVEFVVPEVTGKIASSEFKAAEVAVTACPTQIIDADGFKSYIPTKDVLCSAKNPEAAGVAAGAINTKHNIFVRSELSEAADGGYVSLPFRIKKPTPFVYSIADPTDFRGGTTMYLVNLTTNVRIPFVRVRGSIAETTTYINQPGDYYLHIDTSPYQPQKNGDIEWSFSVAGGM